MLHFVSNHVLFNIKPCFFRIKPCFVYIEPSHSLLFFVTVNLGGHFPDHLSPEGVLISNLLTSYHKRGTYGRPVFNYSKAVPVKFELQLIQIMDLSEKDQVFKVNVWTNYVSFSLTQISLASFLWDIGKQCKTRSDAAKRGVGLVLHCLLTGVSF